MGEESGVRDADDSGGAGTEHGALSVLTTVGSQEEARELAAGAVERRVAACAQISGAVTSVYRWEGAVQTDPEWQVLFKTSAAAYDALEAYLSEAHPYDVPEIIATRVVRGSAEYLDWVAQETRPARSS